MTDQKYKLISIDPTPVMCDAAREAAEDYIRSIDAASCNWSHVLRDAIAFAPEPVCRWTKHQHSPYVSFHGDCQVYWAHELTKFCPNCGRKVEETNDEV